MPGKKITINMAPADLRKEGSAYDLTLAIGILVASAQIKADDIDKYLIMGELSLDGGLQPIRGALPIAIKAKEEGFTGFFLPKQNVKEAAIVAGLDVYGVENVTEVIDFFEGKKTEPRKPDFNHPIDWEVYNNLSPEPKAVLRTNRGDITIRLLPDIAPVSVVNFVKLAKDGFFDGKNFHRVVSNFVIQGGCPRGDGYGSLDYSIRSEVPQAYYDREGYVGMASAGPDTEGTQFFITHSPTPHLDGNYTIFGRVTEGMNAVHDIMIGDMIEKVLIQ